MVVSLVVDRRARRTGKDVRMSRIGMTCFLKMFYFDPIS
ncbi:MAG: hypothetical protein BSOLF_2080 [Candidatus Carbobacillus altaicus]|uniref:Uncharacterized protein n=1 Tax=Candidatus Carbonibacillus altaicus TaxID=2163959 RepID=A0A2R6Y3F2_9BACL|nr:MAG: hypothetical protein BSOLF_2080 [Candidatus Carbobacillus altaicus]